MLRVSPCSFGLLDEEKHCGKVASGSAEDEQVPKLMAGELSGPEPGSFCAVYDCADCVA